MGVSTKNDRRMTYTAQLNDISSIQWLNVAVKTAHTADLSETFEA